MPGPQQQDANITKAVFDDATVCSGDSTMPAARNNTKQPRRGNNAPKATGENSRRSYQACIIM